MPERKKIGEAGAASPTPGFHELKAEHMAKTNGVIPRGSVPQPGEDRDRRRKETQPKKEAS
jgi:hypothetical protein